jgi:aminoglycoside phosphotransferase family enzyme
MEHHLFQNFPEKQGGIFQGRIQKNIAITCHFSVAMLRKQADYGPAFFSRKD